MEEMICKINCERPGCTNKEEVPATKTAFGNYRPPLIPKTWKYYSTVSGIELPGKTYLLCPACAKQAMKMENEFLHPNNGPKKPGAKK